MSVAVLLLRGMFYAMAFFIGNSSVCITIYCQNGERSMTYYCQETGKELCLSCRLSGSAAGTSRQKRGFSDC